MNDELADQGTAPAEGDAPAESSTPDTDASTTEGSWSPEVQAEFTKKTQALAAERKEWESTRAQQTQQLQQYAQQLQQQQAQAQATATASAQQQNQQQQHGMIDQLRAMPYLDGNTAAQLFERFVTEGIQPLQGAIQQRDKAMSAMYKEYKQLRDQVGHSRGKQAEQELDGLFAKVREEHGLPDNPAVKEWMEDIFYSHEGDDLKESFSGMTQKRWNALEKLVLDQARKKADVAKKSPFPSRGGESSLTSGKTGGYKTPAERAEELWPMLNGGSDNV